MTSDNHFGDKSGVFAVGKHQPVYVCTADGLPGELNPPGLNYKKMFGHLKLHGLRSPAADWDASFTVFDRDPRLATVAAAYHYEAVSLSLSCLHQQFLSCI